MPLSPEAPDLPQRVFSPIARDYDTPAFGFNLKTEPNCIFVYLPETEHMSCRASSYSAAIGAAKVGYNCDRLGSTA